MACWKRRRLSLELSAAVLTSLQTQPSSRAASRRHARAISCREVQGTWRGTAWVEKEPLRLQQKRVFGTAGALLCPRRCCEVVLVLKNGIWKSNTQPK